MKQSFEVFYEANFKQLCLFISKFTINKIEELANDAFMQVYNNDSKFSLDVDRRYYLYAAAKNICLNHVNAKLSKRKINIADTDVNVIALPADDLIDEEIETEIFHSIVFKHILEQINMLPHQQKQIMTLKYLQNRTEAEISEQTGLKIKTVYNHLTQAYKSIKSKLLKAL